MKTFKTGDRVTVKHRVEGSRWGTFSHWEPGMIGVVRGAYPKVFIRRKSEREAWEDGHWDFLSCDVPGVGIVGIHFVNAVKVTHMVRCTIAEYNQNVVDSLRGEI